MPDEVVLFSHLSSPDATPCHCGPQHVAIGCVNCCPPDQQGLADELLLEMGEYSSMPCSADTGIYAAAAPAQPAAAPVGK